ncbi:YciI family protein [Polaromonas sp. A23]|uniref:YciI family protein n=1 Tax=Polaromonas sp. A23 TaxID=1944133 RepID=UPI0009858ECE|nr:YciI family protein [Polaromonas sp. A23]OOG44710.1 dehydrogenase [Polaromonas sp. A23]
MPYMLLIHEPVGQRLTRSLAEGEAVYGRMLQFAAELKSEGVLLGVESLASQDSATRLRVSAGKAQMLDGPFAEAKEMVGGFFLVNCATREEALAIAARCPAAEWATLEVRATGPCFL